MIKGDNQTHEDAHEQLLTYQRAKDMLEDFICGPNIETHLEEFYEYVKEQDALRDIREDIARKQVKDMDSPFTKGRSLFEGVGNNPDLKLNYGNFNTAQFAKFKQEDPYANQYTEVELDNMRVVYTYTQTDPDFMKWADIWLETAVMFPSLVPTPVYKEKNLQYWYSHRTHSQKTDYTQYFHMALGSIAGVSNAMFFIMGRYGIKMYVTEWAPLPVGVPICIKEYTNEARTATRPLPQHWGFKTIYYDIVSDQFLDTAPMFPDEEFPKLDLSAVIRVPDPTEVPEPPGPNPRSPYGLSIELYDPCEADEVTELYPYIFNGHGMTLEMDKPYFDGGVSLWGIQTLQGLSINKETGGLQVDVSDGIEAYPLVLNEAGTEVLSAGGLGVQASLTDDLEQCNNYIDDANTIMDIVKILQYISELFPCL